MQAVTLRKGVALGLLLVALAGCKSEDEGFEPGKGVVPPPPPTGAKTAPSMPTGGK